MCNITWFTRVLGVFSIAVLRLQLFQSILIISDSTYLRSGHRGRGLDMCSDSVPNYFADLSLRMYFCKISQQTDPRSPGSLNISPIGGKIMFKDVLYVDKNMLVKVFDGYVSVRYMLSNYRKSLEDGMQRCFSV